MDWLEDWQNRVNSTEAIKTGVVRVPVILTVETVGLRLIDECEVIYAYEHQLSNIIRMHTPATTFLVHRDDHFERHSIDTESQIIKWPSNWTLVADNIDDARERTQKIIDLIEELSHLVNWLPKISFQEASTVCTDSISMCEFSPADLVTNHPHHHLWNEHSSESSKDLSSCEDIVRNLQIRRIEIRTSTVEEAKRSLEAIEHLLPLIANDVYNWKWTIIAAHNALQNFMVAALQGSYAIRVLKTDKDGSPKSPIKLLDFPDLFRRVKCESYMGQYTDSVAYKENSGGTVGQSVSELNRLRNSFIHFDPKTLVLSPGSVAQLPRMIENIIELIEFLAFESNNVHWHNYPIERVESRLLLLRLKAMLAGIADETWEECKRLRLGLKPSQVKLRASLTRISTPSQQL